MFLTDRKIILVGASVRSLAESAVRGGLVPICFDYFRDQDLQQVAGPDFTFRITSPDDALSLIARLSAAIPIIITGGLEYETERIRLRFGNERVAGSSCESISRVRNPGQLFETLARANYDVLPWTEDLSTARNLTEQPDVQWLNKKTTGSGGGHISKVCSTIPTSDLGAEEESDDTYFQQFADGIPFSATYVSAGTQLGDVEFLGATLQLSGSEALNAHGFQFCGNAGPVKLGAKLRAEVVSIGQFIAESFALRGAFGIDFVVSDARLYALEVNPRPTASHELLEFALPTSPGIVSRHLAACGLSQFEKRSAMQRVQSHDSDSSSLWTRLVLYSPFRRRIDDDFSVALLSDSKVTSAKTPGSAPTTLAFADIPVVGSVVEKGEPVCSIYAPLDNRGNSNIAACKALQDFWDVTKVETLFDEMQDRIAQLASDNFFPG